MSKEYPELHLSADQAALFGIDYNEICRLALGNKIIRVLADIAEDSGEPLTTITPELSLALNLPEGWDFNLRWDGDKLRIGPLAAIMTDAYHPKRASFGSQDSFFRGLLNSMNHLHGWAYVFTPQDINWQKNRIYGYYLLPPRHNWQRAWFPFPDVCYNRYFKHSSTVPANNPVSMARLQGRVKSFNSHIGTKLKVHRQLAQEADIAAHLPDTRLFSSVGQLSAMLNKYRAVYIKPINGSKGQGITKVSKTNKRYSLKTSSQPREFNHESLAEIMKMIRSASPERQLIIQQAIRVSGQPHFDFRLLIQRDLKSNWSVTGIAARIGTKAKITTNLHTGGHAVSLGEILESRGFEAGQIATIRQEMEGLALRIARNIARSTRLIGELGLDFMVDHRGKVWFLEANPKPARASFAQIDKNLRSLTIARPMEFAYYLAGF
jgi:glutathione synthase/RimK-type ligase-like ATP-grasp enzyme